MPASAPNGFNFSGGLTPVDVIYPGIEAGQSPKPIVMAPGLADRTTPNHPDAPSLLPLQRIQIGSLRIAGVPCELTTMAGRRLRAAIADQFDEPVHVALATCSNAYAHYVTTPEEYAMQNYEGASTLYGGYTLDAYHQELAGIAAAIRNRQPVASVLMPPLGSRRKLRRITIRNDSRLAIRVCPPG